MQLTHLVDGVASQDYVLFQWKDITFWDMIYHLANGCVHSQEVCSFL
jgi:hypothetical protein